jgi:hypothetical protein
VGNRELLRRSVSVKSENEEMGKSVGSYRKRRSVSDSHLPEAKRIMAKHLIPLIASVETAGDILDKREATDIIITCGKVCICYRCKSGKYRHLTDLNIRMSVESGCRTEVHKIREGYGAYYFFCWLDETDSHIEKWMIIDLNVIREQNLLSLLVERRIPGLDCTFGTLKFDILEKAGAVLMTSWQRIQAPPIQEVLRYG